jgi:hypothetical protein
MTITEIPSRDFRMTAKQGDLWNLLQVIIDNARAELGDDMAFSIVLSRASRELRRVLGPEGAAATLHSLANQQAAMVALDLNDA